MEFLKDLVLDEDFPAVAGLTFLFVVYPLLILVDGLLF